MADINLQIAEALSRGLGPQDILQGLSESKDPEHRAWIANYKTNLIADNQPSTASIPPTAPNVSGVKSLGNAFNNIAQSYADLPMWEQLAIPPAVLATGYVAKKAGDLVFENLRDRQEVRKQAALNALEPSAAVKVQQEQLKLQQAEQANRFAQQAQQGNVGPVEDPLLNARVQTETQRAASEAARTKAAEAQAQLIQEKLIAAQRKAAMVKANPVGAAAQVAAAENLPPESQIGATPKPTVSDLQQKLGITSIAETFAAPPANAEPAPVSPETATPAKSATPSTLAEVVTDPTATPVEKAIELTKETPVVETPKVAGAVAPNVPEGMRPNPISNKVKGEVIGRGAYNWIAGQVGPEAAPKVWQQMIGSKNIPYDPKVLPQMFEDYKLATMAGGEPGVFPDNSGKVTQKGGAYPRSAFVPDYIKGAVTPSALATTAVAAALPALGIAAYRKYQGNEAAVNASLQDAKDSLQSLATMPYDVSKAALKGDFGPLKDLMLSMNPGSLLFNEMNKNDEAIIKKMIQKEKVGAGRGMQGVPPPTR